MPRIGKGADMKVVDRTVILHQGLTNTSKLIYTIICCKKDYPYSISDLMEITFYSYDQVRDAIDELLDLKVIYEILDSYGPTLMDY